MEEKRRKTDKIALFSIGVKLVTIVTLIVLVSLGSITALVSWLVREDLQIAAEDGNFEANRRSAAETEDTLIKTRADTLVCINTITSLGNQTEMARNNTDYFFKQNPRIAAFLFTMGSSSENFLVNRDFFLSRDIDPSLADAFREKQRTAVRRAAAGETTVINAAPHFGSHLLAMFFPGEQGGVMTLFSPENLNTSFGSGLNRSWMINSSGDILVHADFEQVRNGVNVSGHDFIRGIQESSSRSKQSLINSGFGVTGNQKPSKGIGDIAFIRYLHSKFIAFFKRPEARAQDESIRQFMAYTKLNTGGCTVITTIEYGKVFEGIEATTRRNIYLTIAVLSFSIMLIWFFSKSISTPLKNLAAAARKIEGGEFDVPLRPKGRDEIGVLTGSFQKMCSALHIFGKFTNKEIAVKAMRGEIKPGGLPKHATIFFSDIRSFTEKSETFTKVFNEDASDKIVSWLNHYFSKMVDCVEKNNGTIDKFIGDAVMAHWGTASTSGAPAKDALNCIKAALWMRKALHEMNKEREKDDPGNPPIRIGCGINTGIVTAGQLGSEMRMEYTVIGDPVNLASRMEALNKPLGTDILISEDTYILVKEFIIAEEMPSVTVKGKQQPVRVFAVINLSSGKFPKTLADVRRLLGIKAPDLAMVDVDADEKKYRIGEGKQEK